MRSTGSISSLLLYHPALTGRPNAWRHVLAALGLCLCVLIVLYWPTLISMATIWFRSGTFAHGVLIVPVSLFLVWRKRRELRELTPAPDPVGVLLLAVLCVCWVATTSVNVLVGEQLSVMLMVPALVLTLCGAPAARAILFPLAFLIFAVPMGEGLVPILQDFTAIFTTQALAYAGIPVYLEGRFLSIPTGNFEVAETCSGIRYLIASVTFSCLYGYLSYRAYWRRVVFVGVAIVVAIVANGLRASGIVLLAHFSDMRIAVGTDHLIHGWLFFGVVIALLLVVGRALREPPDADASAATPT